MTNNGHAYTFSDTSLHEFTILVTDERLHIWNRGAVLEESLRIRGHEPAALSKLVLLARGVQIIFTV